MSEQPKAWMRRFKDGTHEVSYEKWRESDHGDARQWEVIPLFERASAPPFVSLLDKMRPHVVSLEVEGDDDGSYIPWNVVYSALQSTQPTETRVWHCECCGNYYKWERLVCPVSGDNRPELTKGGVQP